jgi:uncharacterized membrane protein (UPF0127 family)
MIGDLDDVPPGSSARLATRRRMLALLAGGVLLPAMAQAQSGPQAALPSETLTIVTHDGEKHVFHVEMALTDDQQETGLMFRPTVAANGGMLFDWGHEERSRMWMKNTIASLDMLFIGADGTIRRIVADTVPQSLAIIDSKVPVRATLELAAGTAARLDIRVGDTVRQRVFGNAP